MKKENTTLSSLNKKLKGLTSEYVGVDEILYTDFVWDRKSMKYLETYSVIEPPPERIKKAMDFINWENSVKINNETMITYWNHLNELVNPQNSLGPQPTPSKTKAPKLSDILPTVQKQSPKENSMTTLYGNDENLKTNQLNVLGNDLRTAYYGKTQELKADFNMSDDDAPKTPGEFKDRVSKGLVTFRCGGNDLKDDQKFPYNDWDESLRWRDPSKPKNSEGYEKATTKLGESLKDYTTRVLVLQNPEDGLKVLEEFKALPTSTFH